MEARTIQMPGETIINSRLWLKREMERFGRIEVCHTGNRQNLAAEPPWVRFEKASSAEVALQAINAGQVLLEGVPIQAEYKKSGRQQGSSTTLGRRERDMEITSRDIVRDDQRRGGDDRRRYRSNSPRRPTGRGVLPSSRDLIREEYRRR